MRLAATSSGSHRNGKRARRRAGQQNQFVKKRHLLLLLAAIALTGCDFGPPHPGGQPFLVGKLNNDTEVWCVPILAYGNQDRIYVLRQAGKVTLANSNQAKGKGRINVGGVNWETSKDTLQWKLEDDVATRPKNTGQDKE